MESNKYGKYSSEEILQILNDQYNFQANVDPEVDKGENLTFTTTIVEWIDICDLLEPNKLAVVYHDSFELKANQSELIELLLKKDATVKMFCDYISQNANKVIIKPSMSLGKSCLEASIFKTLKSKLEEKGIDTKNFKPSTEFLPFFDKHAPELVEVVSKLAPGSLRDYEFKDNLLTKISAWSFFFAIIIIVISWIMYEVTWITWVPFMISLLLFFIGKKFKPAKYEIGGYHTIRDLIIGMKNRLEQNGSGVRNFKDTSSF